MEHDEVLELLPAYVDQELSVSETIQIERHLSNCIECQQDYVQQSQLSAQLKAPAFRFEAPAGLAQRINEALPRAVLPGAVLPEAVLPIAALPEAALPEAALPIKQSNLSARTSRWSHLVEKSGWRFDRFHLGALMATLLAVLWSIGIFLSVPNDQDRLTDEVIANHVRSLQVDHLSDVVSTDRHTVKPWFNGKLNFSPPVIELAPQGFPLIGGRLDYVNGHPVAALIYRRQLHPINLYVWPTGSHNTSSFILTRQGYQVAHWTSGDMTYWAVSDVAAEDLTTFESLLRQQIKEVLH